MIAKDVVHHLTVPQRNALMLWTAEWVLPEHLAHQPDDITALDAIEHLRHDTVTLDNLKPTDTAFKDADENPGRLAWKTIREAVLSSVDSPWAKRTAGLAIFYANHLEGYADEFWDQVAAILDVPAAHRTLWADMASDWESTPTDLTTAVRKLHE